LFLGTIADNTRDALAKGLLPTGENHYANRHPELVVRGEKCSFSKLKEAEVIEIRRLYATGSISRNKLGAKFGVDHASIRDLLAGRSWRHLL
jgi:hypothetical protein